jgi:hypothetical protein
MKNFQCLVILDDVIADLRKMETHPMVNSLVFNRRHLLINGVVSIFITT